jgi:hypothetical protein
MMDDIKWKLGKLAVPARRALGSILCLAAPVAVSNFITASNSAMALAWVGQYLNSAIIASGVSLGASAQPDGRVSRWRRAADFVPDDVCDCLRARPRSCP